MKKESNVTTETAMETTKELENADLTVFGKRDINKYNSLLKKVDEGFTKASDAYVTIACAIWQIYHNEYYRIDKYKNIAEFAEVKYEIKKSTTHNYIKVVEKFGHIVDGKALGLKEEYREFKCSQLINMLTFTPEQLEFVLPSMSVREIIEYGKKPLISEFDDSENKESAESVEPNDTEANSEESMSDYLTAPEIESGRTFLAEFTDFTELENLKETVLSAYNDLRTDKNFAKKKVRFVLELAYD